MAGAGGSAGIGGGATGGFGGAAGAGGSVGGSSGSAGSGSIGPTVLIHRDGPILTHELGGVVLLDIALSQATDAVVTVQIASSDATEASVEPTHITFTATDWNRTQAVAVRGLDDRQHDGSVAYEVRFSVETTGSAYSGVSVPPISALNVERIVRPSEVSTMGLGTQESRWIDLSGDGMVAVFESDQLLDIDTNGVLDVYRYDRRTDELTLLSLNQSGGLGASGSNASTISTDGHAVAFATTAADMFPGSDDNGSASDVVLDHALTGQRTLATRNSPPQSTQANSGLWSDVHRIGLSASAGTIGFTSTATNLVPGLGTPEDPHAYLFDVGTGTTEYASGLRGNSESSSPALSADGRYVAFRSTATNLTGDSHVGFAQVYLRDRQAPIDELTVISRAGEELGNETSDFPSVSADGTVVAFESSARNLLPGGADTNGLTDVFVYDTSSQQLERVSVASDGTEGAGGDSIHPHLSADGRLVAFMSKKTNLVQNDTNSAFDIFVHDRITKTTVRVNLSTSGLQSLGDEVQQGHCRNPRLSADGRFVGFECEADNLVPEDTNRVADVFIAAVPSE